MRAPQIFPVGTDDGMSMQIEISRDKAAPRTQLAYTVSGGGGEGVGWGRWRREWQVCGVEKSFTDEGEAREALSYVFFSPNPISTFLTGKSQRKLGRA